MSKNERRCSLTKGFCKLLLIRLLNQTTFVRFFGMAVVHTVVVHLGVMNNRIKNTSKLIYKQLGLCTRS